MFRAGRPSPADAAAAAANAQRIHAEAQARAQQQARAATPLVDAEQRRLEREERRKLRIAARDAQAAQEAELQQRALARIAEMRPAEMNMNLPLDEATALKDKYVYDLATTIAQNDPNADLSHAPLPEDLWERSKALFDLQVRFEKMLAYQLERAGAPTQKFQPYTPEESTSAVESHTKDLLSQQKKDEAFDFLRNLSATNDEPTAQQAATSVLQELKGKNAVRENVLPMPGWMGFNRPENVATTEEGPHKPIPMAAHMTAAQNAVNNMQPAPLLFQAGQQMPQMRNYAQQGHLNPYVANFLQEAPQVAAAYAPRANVGNFLQFYEDENNPFGVFPMV